MTSTHQAPIIKTALRLLAVGGTLCLLAACATSNTMFRTPASAQPSSGVQQESFASPQDAVDALVAATRRDDKAELLRILGPDADKLISSGDKVADQEARQKFLDAYDTSYTIEDVTEGRAELVIGEEDWPLPIPLLATKNGWQFDAMAGEEEILNRRIGRNELNVVEISRAYVEAQREFADQSPHHQYAQLFHSHDGQHDGLYWPVSEGEDESPLGSLIADATAEGYAEKALSKHAPYHGYYYRILKSQGQHAAGGAKDYVVKGRMTKGFALIAFPARYGDSGVMTFMVNQTGIVYERNLGPATLKIARNIRQYDPDSGWNIVR